MQLKKKANSLLQGNGGKKTGTTFGLFFPEVKFRKLCAIYGA